MNRFHKLKWQPSFATVLVCPYLLKVHTVLYSFIVLNFTWNPGKADVDWEWGIPKPVAIAGRIPLEQ